MTVPTRVTYCVNGCTHRSDGDTIRVQTDPPSLICRRCEDNLTDWLDRIPDTYALLPIFISHGTAERNPDTKMTKAAEAPAPMRLDVVDLLDERRGRRWLGTYPTEDRRGTLGTLESWARLVREERHIDTPASPPTVLTEARCLVRHLLWICEQQWVDELYADIKTLNRALRDTIGDYRPRPVGRCQVDQGEGDCGGPLMPATFGGVRCARCGATWDIDALRRLGMVIGQAG